MKVNNIRLEWADGEVVEITFSDGCDFRLAMWALETFRLELMRAAGDPPKVVRSERPT